MEDIAAEEGLSPVFGIARERKAARRGLRSYLMRQAGVEFDEEEASAAVDQEGMSLRKGFVARKRKGRFSSFSRRGSCDRAIRSFPRVLRRRGRGSA